jgi:hypothetical protein
LAYSPFKVLPIPVFFSPTDPTDPSDPSDPTDQSEKTIDQITNSRAIPSVKAATLQIFRVFRAFRGQKIGCGRQPTPSLFVWFVVKKMGYPSKDGSGLADPVPEVAEIFRLAAVILPAEVSALDDAPAIQGSGLEL